MNRILRETILVHLFKSTTIANIFLYWKIDLLCIFNIVKDIMHEFIRDIFKMTI